MTDRIILRSSVRDAVLALGEGNFGAVHACFEMLRHRSRVHPDLLDAPFWPLISLDFYGIYGSAIWVLYKWVCHEDVGKMIGLLIALDLGIAGVNARSLEHAARNRGAGIDIEEVVKVVKSHLPSYNPEARAP
jgi:hypothetical protein